MSDGTKIEWTDATWNVVNGCSVHTPGCTNCYAMKLAGTRLRNHPSRVGLTRDTKAGPVWTGEVRFNDKVLLDPLRWKRPRRIFVCAHGDLFHENVPDEWIDQVFAVMALCPQHQFQVLTKRSARMREYLLSDAHERILMAAWDFGALVSYNRPSGLIDTGHGISHRQWPMPNVWAGVSVEDQKRADERIPDLLATPAAVRWISGEPLLGPVELSEVCNGWYFQNPLTGHRYHDAPQGVHSATDMSGAKLDWVVVGGESGPGARPMHPDWARSLRDQCAAASVPFLFKQWGEWAPLSATSDGYWPTDTDQFLRLGPDGRRADGGWPMQRVGKKLAGRTLDGLQHDDFPAAQGARS